MPNEWLVVASLVVLSLEMILENSESVIDNTYLDDSTK
jgi:hypothetical protein